MMDYLQQALHVLLHLDNFLVSFIAAHGLWTYLLVFVVIFCETGLVVTPFLPGDSLLFTLGSLSALVQNPLNILILLPLLIGASILGNQVNYWIGRAIGPRVFTAKRAWFLNQKHLEKAHQFYEKQGGKTIVMARFIPVIRTFAPFVAGVSGMSLRLFQLYNISSAVLWVGSLLCLGYFLGSQPLVQDNFTLVIYAIIGLSLLPPVMGCLYQRVLKSS